MAGLGTASDFRTGERSTSTLTNLQCQLLFDPNTCGHNAIENHTTYRVVVRESETNTTSGNVHNFSAVVGVARHIERSCPPFTTGQNGVLWFNDQFFVGSEPFQLNPGPCIQTEDCSTGCYVIAVTQGGADPAGSFGSAVRRFVYLFTDPNGVPWETREYFGGGQYFWVVTIGSLTTDSAANLPGGTTNRGTGSASQLNTAKGTPTGSNNTYVNGCTGADASSIPECYSGGFDHNPSGEGSNTRQYNFALLIDMIGSATAGSTSPPVNKLSGMNAMGVTACTATASDDGASHASQGAHVGGCPHTHREGKVDLWFSHTQPASLAGTTISYGSTFAYH
ncbi:MAG: hypothetical protein HY556_10590 [Euryarchaeota archaeon]|nr:hypothetical protein [Euryarchaeota archaeon]